MDTTSPERFDTATKNAAWVNPTTSTGEVREPTHRRTTQPNDPVRMTTLSVRAAARYLGIPTPTLRAWSDIGVGPLPDHRGRYDRATVAWWLRETNDQLAALLRPTVDTTSASTSPNVNPWA